MGKINFPSASHECVLCARAVLLLINPQRYAICRGFQTMWFSMLKWSRKPKRPKRFRVVRTAHFSFVQLFVYLAAGAVAWSQGGARLSGIVVDQTSTPVTGVSVTLSSLDRAFQAKTASDGLFRFQNVPPGAYEFEIAAPGFVKQKRNVQLSQGESRQFRIVLIVGTMPDMDYCGPHPTVQYETADPNERQLVGTVSDYSGGARIAGAKIALLQPGEKKPFLTCRSDRTGKFVLENPPAGRYTLRISRTGYQQEDIDKLLIPREDKTHVDVPMLQQHKVVVCQ